MIVVDRCDTTAILALDRPESRNALDAEHCESLRASIGDVVRRGARSIVLTARGPVFCAGADFAEVRSPEFRTSLYAMLSALADVDVPVVAAVDGPAIGAGTQLAIACDLRVGSERAVFALPTAKLGIAVDPWTVRRLATVAGSSVTRRMLLACETINASDALASGLIDCRGGVEEAVALSERMAELAPLTLAYNKRCVRELLEPPIEASGLMDAYEGCWRSVDSEEAFRARAEARPPKFEGR